MKTREDILIGRAARQDTLTETEHGELGCALRDWAERARRGTLDAERRGLLDRAVGLVSPHAPSDIDRLGVSYHPAAGHPMVRVVESSALDGAFAARCAFATPGLPERVLVWVDPAELHFRTYDHILPLDDVLDRAPLDVALSGGFEEVAEGVWVGALVRGGALESALHGLDALGLYVSPLHARERGGERFIFHSGALARGLTEVVEANAPQEVRRLLSHVNPVFRMNRFAPGDDGFSPHHDTPYRDAARAQHSRYTMIVYMTGGEGAPALGFEGHELPTLAPMTCVIFDQKLKHHAKPFVDGDKVFIRTELVHEDGDEVVEDLALASAFSRACYLTHESLVFPELEAYMGECYARAARVHWEGAEALRIASETRPMILKCFRGVSFLTDGHDVWFMSEDMGLEDAAAFAVLDFFDVEIDGRRFKTSCDAEVVEAPTGAALADFIASTLSARARPQDRPFGPPPLDDILPPGEDPDYDICCPSPECDWNGPDTPPFEPTRCEGVIDVYEFAAGRVRARLGEAPVVLMGQEVWLNPSRFLVTENQIHVLSADRLEPIHFAAMSWCWHGHERSDYIVTELSVTTLSPMLPPILWRREGDLLLLKCDFFQNTWQRSGRPSSCGRGRVFIPRVASRTDSGRDVEWRDAMGLHPHDPW